MKINVNINKKIGVINITSNSFILEDLKAHICTKLNLNVDEYKMKMSLQGFISVELIEVPTIPIKQQSHSKGLMTNDDIEKSLKGVFNDINFVRINGTMTNSAKPEINVFFDNIDGAITYFGTHQNDYNKPINYELQQRVNKVYEIIKPFLHLQYISGLTPQQ